MKLAEQLNTLKSDFEMLRDEEQDAYDRMPESFQAGARGEAAETILDNMDDVLCSLQDAIDTLETLEE